MIMKATDLVREDCRNAVKGQEKLVAALKNDAILITGGTGFMGTWLAEMLTCLNDEFSFQSKIYLLARNTDDFQKKLPHLASRKDVVLIKSDVRRIADVPKDVSWIIHAAATPDNRAHSSYPTETMSTIAEGTAVVVRATDRCSTLKKFLNISSGLVSGTQPWDMEHVSESYVGAPVLGAIASCYAESKRFAEMYCGAARSEQKLPIVNARPFAFIGPYQSLKTPWAINNFIFDALTTKIIRVLGDGQTVRSYLYASDMSFWLLRILTDGVCGQSYNVGSPDGISLEKLATLIAGYFDPEPEIRLHESAASAARRTRFVPDVSLVAKTLNLSVKTTLKDAIERTIAWNRLYKESAKTE